MQHAHPLTAKHPITRNPGRAIASLISLALDIAGLDHLGFVDPCEADAGRVQASGPRLEP